MAVLRRTRPAPEPVTSTTAVRRRITRASPEQPAEKPVAKVIPIVSRPAAPQPQETSEEGHAGTDYAAVVARYESKIKNPMTAIRARCIQCCNGQMSEVTKCPATTCALHAFRLGKNPFHKRSLAYKEGVAGQEDEGDDDE